MTNGITRLFLSISGLGLVVAAILSQVHWTLTAACLCFIIYGVLAFAAGWHTYHQDTATMKRRPARQPTERSAIRVGSREIPVNGRLAPRNERVQA